MWSFPVRRNRQKLHRELRLRSEARKAELRLRRLAARGEQERSRRVFEHPRVRAPLAAQRPSERLAAEWPSIHNLLVLAQVDRALLEKVSRLCAVLVHHLPQLVSAEWLPWLTLLALPEWVRPIERLRLPSGSVRRKREAVAVHLLARYPVPPFLLRALDVEPLAVARVPLEDRWAVEALAHVGRGGSLREIVGTEAFPAPLTRRMCHRFLDATADTPPVAALRRAQVEGLGGPPALAARLLATRLGDLHGPDPRVGEPYLQRVVDWLCRRTLLHEREPALLDDIVAWAVERNRVEDGFSLEGRSEAAVVREVERFRIGRALAADPGDALPDAGIGPWRHEAWTVEQLVRRRSLWEEGEHLRHCVALYTNLARKRKVAVFSLRRGGVRRATIEVALGAGAILQAKGFANQALESDDEAIVRAWAAFARLRIVGL